MEWPCISYNYNLSSTFFSSTNVESKLGFFLDRTSSFQTELFRVYRDPKSQNVAGLKLSFKDEIFEQQFLSIYAWQKHETFKTYREESTKKNKRKQLWAFVEQHFDQNSAHDRLRELPRHLILNGRDSRRPHQQLERIDESVSEYSPSEMSRLEDHPDNITDYDDFNLEESSDLHLRVD